VIFWDEFVSNHREIFESVVQFLPNAIFVFAGDFRQILPVIEWGSVYDIIGATIMSSSYWPRFETLSLTKNMRLVNSSDIANIRYSEAILAIGEGRSHEDALIVHEDGNDSVVVLPTMEYFLDRQEAINWLYPQGQPLATDRGSVLFSECCSMMSAFAYHSMNSIFYVRKLKFQNLIVLFQILSYLPKHFPNLR